MTATDLTPHQGAVLRAAIKSLSADGITYEKICAPIDSRHNWNENALKTFVSRKTTVRLNSKTRALLNRVAELGQQPDMPFRPANEDLRILQHELMETEEASHATSVVADVDQRFQGARQASVFLEMSETLALVREGRSQGQVIIIKVNTKKSSAGYSFTMKIQGDHKRRRIILGNVLQTQMNVYFMGAAYKVRDGFDDQGFYDLDAFSPKERDEAILPNIVGIETFCVSRTQVSDQVSSAFFTGLDGLGNPISGNGVLITGGLFNDYGIKNEVFSSVACTTLSPKLQEIMEIFKCGTRHPDISDMSEDYLIYANQ